MRIIVIIIAVSWIAFWAFWIVAAFASKPLDRSAVGWTFIRRRLIVIPIALVLAIAFDALPAGFRSAAVATGPLRALGLPIFLLGMAIALWARFALGRNWGMPMTRKSEPELVTSGPYRYVRHPIYSGLMVMALGSALTVNSYWLLAFSIFAVYFTYSARIEEQTMVKQLPNQYPKYMRRTKMLIPFVL